MNDEINYNRTSFNLINFEYFQSLKLMTIKIDLTCLRFVIFEDMFNQNHSLVLVSNQTLTEVISVRKS